MHEEQSAWVFLHKDFPLKSLPLILCTGIRGGQISILKAFEREESNTFNIEPGGETLILTTLAAMAQEVTEATRTAGHLPAPEGFGIWDMMLHAGPVVQAIIAGLFVLSLVCWGIIVTKTFQLRKVNRESEAFADLFMRCTSMGLLQTECERLKEGHLTHIFRTGITELNRVIEFLAGKGMKNSGEHESLLLENVNRAIQGGIISKRKRLERLLPFLATTGSTAPFIGLFGTVWGIMTSFQNIGMMGSANLAVVAPGISEALVATAIGLAAAIPAVVAYNHFSNNIQTIEDDMLQFSSDFLNTLKTDLIGQAVQEEPETGCRTIAGVPWGMRDCMKGNSTQVG